MANKNLGKEVFQRSYDPELRHRLGQPSLQLAHGRLGPAGSPAARVGERRLLPQLVGQLVRGRQPRDRGGRLHAVQHHGAGRCAAAGRRRPRRSAACTTSSRARSAQVDELAQHRRATSASSYGELAGRGRQRRRAAAQRADGAGRHEHRAPALGRLRDARRHCRSTATGPRGANNSIAGAAQPGRTRIAASSSRTRREFRGLATYTIPQGRRPGERHVASIPGDDLAANYTVTNAIANAGRSRSAAISRTATSR